MELILCIPLLKQLRVLEVRWSVGSTLPKNFLEQGATTSLNHQQILLLE